MRMDRRTFFRVTTPWLAALIVASRVDAPAATDDVRAARIERKAVESTSIASIGYDAARQALEIEFRSGAIYRYLAVPPAVFEALMSADSKGRYFSQHIRSRFEFVRVEARRP